MTTYKPGDVFTLHLPKPLWRIVGHGKSGGGVTINVRAADYIEAVKLAKIRGIAIRDVVLIEGNP